MPYKCISTTDVSVERVLAISKEDRHYIAGYFDGEGCVGLYKKRNTSGEIYAVAVRVCIAQQEPDLIVWIHNIFGGRFVRHDRVNSSYYTLSMESISVCRTFLSWITPYLRSPSKRLQASMLLNYCVNYRSIPLEQKLTICDDIKAVKVGVKEASTISIAI